MSVVFSNTRHEKTFSDCLRDVAYKYNHRNHCDGKDILLAVNDTSVPCVFFDPQYRGVLDKMAYGNEGVSRGKRRSALPQMSDDTIRSLSWK